MKNHNTKILIKTIKAGTIANAMKIIKVKYPYSKFITYKMDKDFRYTRNRDYLNRTMKVAFIGDTRKVLE